MSWRILWNVGFRTEWENEHTAFYARQWFCLFALPGAFVHIPTILHKLFRAGFVTCEYFEDMRGQYLHTSAMTVVCFTIIYPESFGSGGIDALILFNPGAVCLWASKPRPWPTWPCGYNEPSPGLLRPQNTYRIFLQLNSWKKPLQCGSVRFHFKTNSWRLEMAKWVWGVSEESSFLGLTGYRTQSESTCMHPNSCYRTRKRTNAVSATMNKWIW